MRNLLHIVLIAFVCLSFELSFANQQSSELNRLRSDYQSQKLKDISDLIEDFPTIKKFSEEDQISLLKDATDSLALSALERRVVPNSSLNKLYYIIYEIVKKEFGLPSKLISDASVIRDFKSDIISLVIYSTDGFQGSQFDRRSHLYYKYTSLASAGDKQSFVKQFEWTVASNKYKAEVNIKSLEHPENLVSNAQSPNYKALTREKSLNTMIIGDQSNVLFTGKKFFSGKTDTEAMLILLVNYLKDQGFEFESKTPSDIQTLPSINDAWSYVRGRITADKNPVHILYKDAHNGGEDKFIFRLPTKARLLKAQLKHKDGLIENFEYVFPDFKDIKTKFKFRAVSNKEFGDLVKQRENASGLELIYINAACRSIDQAVYEIPPAQTKSRILINIPSDVDISMFSLGQYSMSQALLTSLRQQKDYSEIREALNEVKKNINDDWFLANKQNWPFLPYSLFILPNEEKYRTQILERAIDVDIKVYQQSSDQNEWEIIRILEGLSS